MTTVNLSPNIRWSFPRKSVNSSIFIPDRRSRFSQSRDASRSFWSTRLERWGGFLKGIGTDGPREQGRV